MINKDDVIVVCDAEPHRSKSDYLTGHAILCLINKTKPFNALWCFTDYTRMIHIRNLICSILDTNKYDYIKMALTKNKSRIVVGKNTLDLMLTTQDMSGSSFSFVIVDEKIDENLWKELKNRVR